METKNKVNLILVGCKFYVSTLPDSAFIVRTVRLETEKNAYLVYDITEGDTLEVFVGKALSINKKGIRLIKRIMGVAVKVTVDLNDIILL